MRTDHVTDACLSLGHLVEVSAEQLGALDIVREIDL